MSTLRIALIGAGGIGEHHAARYSKVNGAELAAVVDVDGERAKTVAEKYGVPRVYTSIDDAIAAGGLDAVDICLPTWLHKEATVKAARAGLHVLCEKPMAVSLADADEMIAATKAAGVTLMIAQCRRWDNYWGAVDKALKSGVIGRPVVWRDINGIPGPKPPWFYARDKGLGPLVDGAIHNYDFARVMFGEPEWVFASTHTFKDVTAPDTGIAIVRFQSGDELQLSWSWGLPEGASASRAIDIMGPGGVLYFGNPPADRKLEVPAPPEGHGQIVAVTKGGEVVPFPYPKNDMYVDEIQHFVDCVKSGATPNPSGEENRRSLAIAMAVIESGDKGTIINL